MTEPNQVEYLYCHTCGKRVSSGFIPLPVVGFKGIVVRAWIECPECIEKKIKEDEKKLKEDEHTIQ